MPATPDLLLGIDVGTSAVKVALFDAQGTLHGSAAEPVATCYPQPGRAEQDPAGWWRAIGDALRTLHDGGVPPARIAGIGLCAQMCGAIAADADGRPLHNALIWLDTRSRDQARLLMGGWPRVKGYGLPALLRWLRATNGAPNLAGRDPVSKFLWLRERRPELWQRTRYLLDVKDWLLLQMTGAAVTTPDCAHLTWLYDSRSGRRGWSAGLLRTAGIDAALLPRVVGACELAGRLTANAAVHLGLPAGLPVAGGSGDLVGCGLGAGGYGDPAAHLYVGTSNWLAAFTGRRRVDVLSGIGTVCGPGGGDYLLVAAQECAGAAVAWGCAALGLAPGGVPDFAVLDRLAAAAKPGAGGVLFLPWLQGERVPVDDPDLRGGFVGIGLSTTRADLARALLEGVALNCRWALGPFMRLHGGDGALRMVGGGARSPIWAQIFADVLQRPIHIVEHPELAGARGAALTAAVVAGRLDDLAGGRDTVRVTRVHEPDAGLDGLYGERLALLRRLARHARVPRAGDDPA